MELYLHIGTNKTGSSFIQSSLIENKANLVSEGVYVPPSKWDEEMRAGKITPGNGHQLAHLLIRGTRSELSAYFRKVFRQAEESNSKKVVLSSEVLIRLFSNYEILELLTSSAKVCGFKSIKAICFFRNLYQHALSLYKHRAKDGRHSDYSKWLGADYETLRVTQPFLTHFKHFDVNWSFRVYKKDPEYLLKTFYNDFLGVGVPPLLVGSKTINASLSLNNIRLIQLMEPVYPGLNERLYACLIQSDTTRLENHELEQQFYRVCIHHFQQHSRLISNLAELLPGTERASFLERPNVVDQENEDIKIILTSSHEDIVRNSLSWYKANVWKLKAKRIYRHLHKSVGALSMEKKFDSVRYGGSLRSGRS